MEHYNLILEVVEALEDITENAARFDLVREERRDVYYKFYDLQMPAILSAEFQSLEKLNILKKGFGISDDNELFSRISDIIKNNRETNRDRGEGHSSKQGTMRFDNRNIQQQQEDYEMGSPYYQGEFDKYQNKRKITEIVPDDSKDTLIGFQVETVIELKHKLEQQRIEHEKEKKLLKLEYLNKLETESKKTNVIDNSDRINTKLIRFNSIIKEVFDMKYQQMLQAKQLEDAETDAMANFEEQIDKPENLNGPKSLAGLLNRIFGKLDSDFDKKRATQILLEMVNCFDYSHIRNLIQNPQLSIFLVPKQVFTQSFSSLLNSYSSIRRYGDSVPNYLNQLILNRSIARPLPLINIDRFNTKQYSSVNIFDSESLDRMNRVIENFSEI